MQHEEEELIETRYSGNYLIMLDALQESIVRHLFYFIVTSHISMSILWNVHLESLERAPF